MEKKIDPTFISNFKHTLENCPYDLNRRYLYNADDLYLGISKGPMCYYDALVYSHYIAQGKQASTPYEQAARSIHDYAIQQLMLRFASLYPKEKMIGVMGGHQLLRTDAMFRQIVFLSKTLTEHGFVMVTGGGPGAMEATHLGAWLAGRSEQDVNDVLTALSAYPSFKDSKWLLSALDIMREYPQEKLPYQERLRYRYESLAIPTWLYGHEPSTPFATHIAKFFDNSIREDAVLTLPFGGIIYTPGSAGTLQEIFQDAVQNHYLSFDISSPMIFLGKDFWMREVPVYPLLEDLMARGKYRNLKLSITDNSEDIIRSLTETINP
ncbi:MAG: hypothetical protein MJZ89_01675 [Paludibacteraceae bacterium]|nr:hypothetical protein [Paludibacteraceae bacterium]